MAEWKIFVNDNLYEVAEFPDNYVEQDVLHHALQYVDLWVEKVEE
jgi:hypothetical protein